MNNEPRKNHAERLRQEAVQEEYGGPNTPDEVDRTEAALTKYLERIIEKE